MASLEWEEGAFLGLRALYHRIVDRPQERAAAAVRVDLGELRASLFLLAQMIAGRPVSLFETDNRILCDTERVFLPPAVALADTRDANAEFYHLKTVVAALAIRRGVSLPSEQPLREGLATAMQEFPSLSEQLSNVQRHLGETDLWEELGRPDFDASPPRAPRAASVVPMDGDCADEITEIEGKGQTGVTAHEGSDDQAVESEMPIHTFEKVEALEEYSGLDRKTDDEDELEDHAEALRSLEMKHVVRSRERPRSIYRSDVLLDGLVFEMEDEQGGAGVPYPEWDYKRQRYRPDWCLVQESRHAGGDALWLADAGSRHRSLVLDLKKRFAAVANEWLRRKRQPFGPDFDIDAIVDGEVARRAGQSASELHYIDRRRSLHDVAALILMDQSYSTDSWVDDARVLDTIRDTVFCVGEVLAEFIERFAIAAFHSNTRRQCSYHQVKSFEDPWYRARAGLGDLDARGYTRIGPALRHAQEKLMRENATRRVILLVSDGRPCDFDRYEGTYGIRDVKKAIETGRANGIQTHAFAIDRQAREYFPRMFTRRHYDVVPHPRALVGTMCELFMRLQTG